MEDGDGATGAPRPRQGLPLILVRGFGGMDVEDERSLPYQGFNDGTVYPHKRGENYIYEGLVLRLLKSDWHYQDATNVVGYYSQPVGEAPARPPELADLPDEFFVGHKVVLDPGTALHLRRRAVNPLNTVWVLRYYDLGDRVFRDYANALVRVIRFIRELALASGAAARPRVNIIAHSMGGLIVREAVQSVYAAGEASSEINRIVTLGTPHQGISFQLLQRWLPRVAAREELERFNPEFQDRADNPLSYKQFANAFPPRRVLTVVGTNYRSYGVKASSALNRLFSVGGEYGTSYNRSDGLVKQSSAQLPGSPRTFVHKCHGGPDSLVTSREAFEIATRFFHGDIHARLRFVKGRVKRGRDWFGRSEFFIGVSIKPRRVDFELFHQSAEAENCYGPFRSERLDDPSPAFDWADGEDLIWEGWLDTSQILPDPSRNVLDLVMRIDFYVGERDLLGVGFSDNVIFRKQYYVRAVLKPELTLYLHTGEQFMKPGFVPARKEAMRKVQEGWEFEVRGTGFQGTFRIELEAENGENGDG